MIILTRRDYVQNQKERQEYLQATGGTAELYFHHVRPVSHCRCVFIKQLKKKSHSENEIYATVVTKKKKIEKNHFIRLSDKWKYLCREWTSNKMTVERGIRFVTKHGQ